MLKGPSWHSCRSPSLWMPLTAWWLKELSLFWGHITYWQSLITFSFNASVFWFSPEVEIWAPLFWILKSIDKSMICDMGQWSLLGKVDTLSSIFFIKCYHMFPVSLFPFVLRQGSPRASLEVFLLNNLESFPPPH